MAVLERDGAFVRRGRNGVRQEKVSGVLAAAFDHRTSRTGDPQMHTHVAVLAMAKAGDGRVLALDGRAIYGLSGALSAIYDFHRDKALMRELNVRFEVNERTGVREIAGVPGSLQELWSSRRAQITPRVEELKAQYLATHGRQAPPEMVAKMAQWATLDTRPAKGEPESTEELFARWRAAASASADTDLAEVWAAAVGPDWLAPAVAQTDQRSPRRSWPAWRRRRRPGRCRTSCRWCGRSWTATRTPPSRRTRPGRPGSSTPCWPTTRS
jgi:hypothetical protein